MKVLLVGFVFLIASGTQAYKYTCNSIDAKGNVASDKCGVACDDEKAPRWVPADVEVRIDLSVLPPGISRDTWKEVALSSLESWNNVSGANFKFRHGGSTVNRNFGSDAQYREMFWVTDADEWRGKVGGGEKGTLGVTLSPYLCPSDLRSHREMYDADLMMNGSEEFPWQASCLERDCQSIRSTFTHELGHVVGLGHPCTLCSNSIMTAKAAYHIEYPMFDDQEGLRTLYPGTSSGDLGTRCDQNTACDNGYECISQEDTHYCSQPCSLEHTCPAGYACDEHMCRFAIGRLAGAVGLGESCQSKYCEADLLCAGSDKTHLYCYAECAKSGGCQQGESCVPLDGEKEKGVCIHVGKLGESCHWKNPCDEKLICVVEADKGTCRVPCVLGQKNTCGQGNLCRDLGQGKSACWGEGGALTPVTNKDDTGSLCSSLPMQDRTGWAHLSSLLILAAIALGLRRMPYRRH